MAKRTTIFAAVFAALLSVTLSVQADDTFDVTEMYWIGNADSNFYTGSLNGTSSNWEDADGTLCLTRYISGAAPASALYTQNCYIYNTPNTVKMDWGDMGVASLTLGDGIGTQTATMERKDGSNNFTSLTVDTILTVQTGGSLTTGSLTITNLNSANGTVTVSGGLLKSNTSIAVTNGTLNLTGGTLQANSLSIGSNGTFSHTGGTLTTNGSGLAITGDYALGSGGTLKPDGPITVSGTAALDGTIDVTIYTASTPSVGSTYTLVSANTLTDSAALSLPSGWIKTRSASTLKIAYENNQGNFYWTDSSGNHNMYTAGNWEYNTENSGDILTGTYIGPTDHNVSNYTRNCYVFSTSTDAKIDWSDLGMASLTVGDGTGTRTANMYSARGSNGFDLLTTLNVNKGGAVTMTNSTPTYVTGGTLNVNGGTYTADAVIRINDGGVLNLSSDGTINVSSAGITNTSGDYSINLSGGTLGTNNASWSSALNATLSNTTTFSPGADQTITWSGVLSGSGAISKTGAGALRIVAGSGGQTYTGGTTVSAGTLYLQGTNQGKSSVGTGDLTINSGATVVAESRNVFGSASADNIPKVIINGGTLTPKEYLHMTILDINGGTINSHGSSGDGLDFNNRNGTITSTGTSSIASRINNRSTLTIDVKNGTLSLTNNLDNGQGTTNKTIKTGSGLLTTSGWINALVDVQEGTLKLTGNMGSGKRFNGEITIAKGALLDCASKDALGWGSANTKMYIYGTMDSTVENETLNNTELHMYGGTAKATSGSTFDILNAGVKFYSYALPNAETTTVSTISPTLLLRHNDTLPIDVAANSQLNLTGEITGLFNNTQYTCSITKLGDGTLKLSGANTYLGETIVSAGVLELTGDAVVANGLTTVGDNGTLVYNVAEGTSKLLTIDNSNKIVSTGEVEKTGDGTLQIYAASAGQVDADHFLVSSGRLDMKEYYNGSLEVGKKLDEGYTTATFSPGNSVGSLTINGVFTLNPGSTLLMEQNASGMDTLIANEFIIDDEAIVEYVFTSLQPGATYEIFSDPQGLEGKYADLDYWTSFLTPEDAYYWNFTTDGYSVFASVDANAVPEPSTWALLALGAAGLMYWRKRKN